MNIYIINLLFIEMNVKYTPPIIKKGFLLNFFNNINKQNMKIKLIVKSRK